MKRARRMISGDKKGIALLASLSLISVMSVLSISLMSTALVEIRSAERFENRMFAFHLADGAVDQTIAALRSNRSYAGLSTTSASNGRTTGTYRTTVTQSPTNSNVYTINAFGTVGSGATSYGYQQRKIMAVVQMPSLSPFNVSVFANSAIAMSGNAITDAYDSRNGAYNAATATSEGHIGTNRITGNAIAISGNVRIKGNATVGPGANVLSTIVTSGNAVITGIKSAAPSLTTLSPVTIPNGLASSGVLSISGNSTVTLSAGNYYYSSINISGNGRLNLTGPANIYVTGNVSISGNGVGTAQNLPTNLRLYVQGIRSVSLTGNGHFYGAIYAPDSAVAMSGNGNLFGGIVSNTLSNSGNGSIHYDKALNQVVGGTCTTGNEMKAWSEVSY